ncbi:ATP-binding protein [Streptomyces sp. NPDC059009]|uniref:ATP-binding protein n=1 Tax=Streptomyces sp. NPDC059009 TaxID=3346694 RepID=UPI0036C764E1
MIYASQFLRRKPWDLPFEAEAREVAGLRRVLKIHLTLWGLPEVVEAAQTCVSELASNVINHVGVGTPATLAVSMRDTYLRIEMHDPDARALPTLLAAGDEEGSGRGVQLIDAITKHRWGVILRGASKVVWCELATNLPCASSHDAPLTALREGSQFGAQVGPYRSVRPMGPGRLEATVAEEAAVELIADLLDCLRAHGCDPDDVLDRAQMHFEAKSESSARRGGGRVRPHIGW